MKTLIIGCGYVGLPLAKAEQTLGHEVTAWVHSLESAETLRGQGFAQIMTGSVGDERVWKRAGTYDRVVHCASSGRGGAPAYLEVFFEGARMLTFYQPKARRLMVSSTSVYGQTRGEVVTEESIADPPTDTGKILREAEEVMLAGGGIVVRAAGIYGPGRAVLFEKLRRGEAIMEGDGARWMNQIHRDDLVAAIELLLETGEPGQNYHAADDEPVSHRDYYAWCANFLGVPAPPSGPVNTERKRGNTNKRVANTKLRALGWEPRFASFRQGLSQLDPQP